MARDIIVIGASTGGFEALRLIMDELPADLPAAVFIVIHIPSNGTGLLPEVLARLTRLHVANGVDGEPICSGRVYVAPPDRHLLLKPGRVVLSRGPRENRFRPAVDPLFRTAANAYGARVIAVVLSGGQDDGVAGLWQVKTRGGYGIAQEPSEAIAPSMPLSAIREVSVDEVLPAQRIGTRLVELVTAETPTASEEPAVSDEEHQPDVAEFGSNSLLHRNDPPSPFTCPECGGALWEIRDGEVTRFRCHVGHAYSDDALVQSQDDIVEEALWHALRALEENAALFRRMAERVRGRSMPRIASTYDMRAVEVERRAAVIRQVLVGGNGDLAERKANEVEPDRG